MNKILITRPYGQSLEFQKKLMDYNIQSKVMPLTKIVYQPDWHLGIDVKQYDLIIFTSSNSIHEFAKHFKDINNKIALVGNQSLHLAKEYGLRNICIVENNVNDLVAQIKFFFTSGSFLYVSGKFKTVDLGAIFNSKYKILSVDTYIAEELEISEEEFKLDDITSVALFSSRAAQIFLKLVHKYKLYLGNVNLFALSEKIAKVVCMEPWGGVYIPKLPNGHEMVKTVVNYYERNNKTQNL